MSDDDNWVAIPPGRYVFPRGTTSYISQTATAEQVRDFLLGFRTKEGDDE